MCSMSTVISKSLYFQGIPHESTKKLLDTSSTDLEAQLKRLVFHLLDLQTCPAALNSKDMAKQLEEAEVGQSNKTSVCDELTLYILLIVLCPLAYLICKSSVADFSNNHWYQNPNLRSEVSLFRLVLLCYFRNVEGVPRDRYLCCLGKTRLMETLAVALMPQFMTLRVCNS